MCRKKSFEHKSCHTGDIPYSLNLALQSKGQILATSAWVCKGGENLWRALPASLYTCMEVSQNVDAGHPKAQESKACSVFLLCYPQKSPRCIDDL